MHERPDGNFCVPVQAYIGVHMSAWSYNNLVQAWEPILEPWNVILKADMNTGSMVRSYLSEGSIQELRIAADHPQRPYHHTTDRMGG